MMITNVIAMPISERTPFHLPSRTIAMANMSALVERYGPAPKAFLTVPMVGAFFIDFTNALIITTYINLVAP